MINDNTLNEAIAEARRFIKKAEELQAASNESVGERGAGGFGSTGLS